MDLTQGLRNWLAYNLYRAAGRYATRTAWAEVFLVADSAPLNLSHYHGIYIGLEKMKIVRRCAGAADLAAELAAAELARFHLVRAV